MDLQYEGNITVRRSLGAPLEVTCLLTIKVANFRFSHRPFLCIFKTTLLPEMEEEHVIANKEVAKLSLAWFSSLNGWVVPLLSELRVSKCCPSILSLALRESLCFSQLQSWRGFMTRMTVCRTRRSRLLVLCSSVKQSFVLLYACSSLLASGPV